MNKKLKRNVLSALLIATVVSAPLMASPIMQKITAYIYPNIEYRLDGVEILEDTQTIYYNGKNYVSVNDIVRALGKDVTFENGKVTITTPQYKESVVINEEIIKEVDVKQNQVTILPVDKADKLENYKILNVGPETKLSYEKNKPVVKISDLEEGMKVKVIQASFETASIPAQTTAYEITILQDGVEQEPVAQNITIKKATIKDVEEDDKTITILPAGKENKPENYIVLNIGQDTKLAHETIKKVVTLESLEEGMTVKVVHSPAVTKSLPPQTSAIEVIVLKENGDLTTDDKDDDFDHDAVFETEIEDAKIIEMNHGKKYMVVKNDKGTYTVKFTHKTKVEFDDADHKKPNVNSLKVGQRVDIELENGVAVEIEVQ